MACSPSTRGSASGEASEASIVSGVSKEFSFAGVGSDFLVGVGMPVFPTVGVGVLVGVGAGVGVGVRVGVGVGAGEAVGVGVGSGSLIASVSELVDQFTEDTFPPLVR